MNGINGYQVYQNNYSRATSYAKADEKPAAGKAENSTAGAKETYGSNAKGTSALSDDAKDLLDRLKKKYGNMDFIIANYDSDEEARKYLAGGTKEYSVLLEPEVLEEMASDKDAEKKYIGLIDDATAKLSDMKEQLSDKEAADVTRMGVTIGKDGSTSYFAELEKSGEKQKERIEKSRAEKKEKAAKEKKAEEKKAEEERLRGMGDLAGKSKRTMVTADSADELLNKIKNVDWDAIKPEQRETVGGIINYGA